MELVKAIFKNRPNRFIAEVEIDGKEEQQTELNNQEENGVKVEVIDDTLER